MDYRKRTTLADAIPISWPRPRPRADKIVELFESSQAQERRDDHHGIVDMARLFRLGCCVRIRRVSHNDIYLCSWGKECHCVGYMWRMTSEE